MNRRPRVLYLSSLPARNTTSGALLIHRHLVRATEHFDVHHAHDAADVVEDENHSCVPQARFFARLQSNRFFPFFWSLNHGVGRAVSAATLDALCDRVRPDVLLTVAEGQLVGPSRRLASRRRLPLVTVFHDWASNWLPAPPWVRRLMDRQLRQLYATSTVNLCVSGPLRDELGAHPHAWLLPPIPDDAPVGKPGALRDGEAPFRTVYTGVFHHLYRDEIEGLARALHAAGESDALRIYGPQAASGGIFTDGPAPVRRMYGGFLKGPAFAQALGEADALLVVSPFGPEWRPIARFSFPSKIPEYCRFGKPILVWGPPDSAAAEWATRSGAALHVSDADPAAAAAAVRRLRDDHALRARLATASHHEAATTFAPRRLQRLFEDALWLALGRTPCPLADDRVN